MLVVALFAAEIKGTAGKSPPFKQPKGPVPVGENGVPHIWDTQTNQWWHQLADGTHRPVSEGHDTSQPVRVGDEAKVLIQSGDIKDKANPPNVANPMSA